jgi:membrane-associated phospholipid phosphatase
LLLIATTSPARADKLEWKDEWPKFRASEYVTTGVATAGLVTLYLIPRFAPTWGGPILFDKPLRSAFRSESDVVRGNWQQASTIAYFSMIGYPIIVDALIVPFARGNSTVAAQTTLINLQAFAISGFIFRATEALVRRARPYVQECIDRTGSYEACKETGLGGTNSFISGHMALAATGAALMCTHHAHLELYGKPWDALACGAGIAVSAGVAVGRMVTDNHYATDILAGAVVGALSGWLVPTLLHYGWNGNGPGNAKSTSTLGTPVPTANATSVGVSWAFVL